MTEEASWRRILPPFAVAALLLTLLGGYIGAYFALVVRTEVWDHASGGGYVLWINMHYRYGGDRARFFFRPIHKLDCLLRPSYWDPGVAGTPRTRPG